MAKSKEAPAAKKNECPVTRAQFRDKAPNAVKVEGLALKKEFESGTLGYFAQISATVEIDGLPVPVKGNAMLFISNSKDAK